MFKLHYHCENNGDGSASVRFHKTKKAAEKADEAQPEPFSESSVGYIKLKIEDGQIFFAESVFNVKKKQYETVWCLVDEE